MNYNIFKNEPLDLYFSNQLIADRKAKSLTFKVPPGTNLGYIKTAIENKNMDNTITVLPEIGANDNAINAQELIENGFDTGPQHIGCHPPHGYYLNLSIMGLKAYILDEKVYEKLPSMAKSKDQSSALNKIRKFGLSTELIM